MGGVCGESKFFGLKDDHARLTRLVWYCIDVDRVVVGYRERRSNGLLAIRRGCLARPERCHEPQNGYE